MIPVENIPISRLRAECDFLGYDTTLPRADIISTLKSNNIHHIDTSVPPRPRIINVSDRSKDPSNIFIGNGAGLHEKGSNKLYISNSSSIHPLIGGDFSTNTVTIHNVLQLNNSEITPELFGNEGDIRRMHSNIYMYRTHGVHAGWYPISFGPVMIV